MVALMPPVHPAVPVTAHLWPGIKEWASRGVSELATINVEKLQKYDWSLKALENWYTHTDPLHSALTFSFFLSCAVFVVGELMGNASSVDRMWAALPVVYSAHFALHGHWTGAANVSRLFSWGGAESKWKSLVPAGVDERMLLVLVLQMIWSARLTGNTLRRGFFNPFEEDYRWPIVRNRMRHVAPGLWPIFDLVFVSFTQIFLLAATALPQYLILTASRSYHPTTPPTPLGWPDFAIAGLMLLNLAIEQVADSQQQAFQNWKHGPGGKNATGYRAPTSKDPKQAAIEEGHLRRGFVTTGLWGYSRHPNFLCEQLNFWILPLFALRATVPQAVFTDLLSALKTAYLLRNPGYFLETLKEASGHLFNYSWLISIAMTALFLGSTNLTEKLSSGKYPKYRQYQKRVGMFLPIFTTLKGVWLFITGQLGQVNEQVYGTSKSKKQ